MTALVFAFASIACGLLAIVTAIGAGGDYRDETRSWIVNRAYWMPITAALLAVAFLAAAIAKGAVA